MTPSMFPDAQPRPRKPSAVADLAAYWQAEWAQAHDGRRYPKLSKLEWVKLAYLMRRCADADADVHDCIRRYMLAVGTFYHGHPLTLLAAASVLPRFLVPEVDVPLPEPMELCQEFVGAWREWQQHLRERGRPLERTAAAAQLRKCQQWGARRAVAALRFSVAQNYLGLYEERRSPAVLRAEAYAATRVAEERAERHAADLAAVPVPALRGVEQRGDGSAERAQMLRALGGMR